MSIPVFLAINNSFLYADHIGSETSYILDFNYVSTQILGINFYIKQNKIGYALVKGKPQISELTNKSLFPTHTTIFLSEVSNNICSTYDESGTLADKYLPPGLSSPLHGRVEGKWRILNWLVQDSAQK